MNKRKLAIIITGLAIGVLGSTHSVQAASTKHIDNSKQNVVLLAENNVGNSVVNYTEQASNRDAAWNEAIRLHDGDRHNNCTFYLASILRGVGINVPKSIGYTANLGDWLEQNGWKRCTNMNNLRPGDIVFSGDTHAYVFLSWADKSKLIANVNDEQAAAYDNRLSYQRNLNGANGDGYIPGDGNDNTYVRATYYMTPENNSNNDSLVVTKEGKTTIQSSIGWLNFRSGNSTNYSILGKIPTGTTVNVLGESNGWYKVSYNGQIGWICGSYTTGIQSNDTSTNKPDVNKPTSDIVGKTTIQSSIGWLNFRNGNSTSYDILGKIPTGTTVNVLGESNGWYKVSYNGQIGWICGSYTTGMQSNDTSTNKPDTSKPTSNISGKTTIQSSIGWLNFRSGNSTSYNILGKIPTGTTVSILGESNGWYKVSYNGEVGWICASYTTGVSQNSSNSTSQSSNVIGTTRIQSSIGWLHLRTGCGTSYGILNKIPTGTQVKVYSKVGSWYKVMYNGQMGWIYSAYTTGIN